MLDKNKSGMLDAKTFISADGGDLTSFATGGHTPAVCAPRRNDAQDPMSTATARSHTKNTLRIKPRSSR